MRLTQRIRVVLSSFSLLGTWSAIRYWLQYFRARLARDQRLLAITTKNTSYPMVFRANTIDRQVFSQIFLDREYECVGDLPDVRLIVDAGANVGFSAVYLLNRYPDSEVLAIEPDPAAFEVLRRNVAPYGSRCKTLNSAVWDRTTGLTLVDPSGAGESWAVQTHETPDGETPDLLAVDVGSLLRDSAYERISLLKIDIEGAESVVFADAPWLDQVDNIVVELHADSPFGDAEAVFFTAIAGRDFLISRLAERTVCRSAS